MSGDRFVVYVSDHRPTCPDALAVANTVRERYPSVEVEIFNVDRKKPRAEVFAVPTYMLGDRIAFLGNPTDEQTEDLFRDSEPVPRNARTVTPPTPMA
jgi:hypothetical protein